ncbi:MAG: ABC transporter substrate-binding protein [Faecousia sp.]
MKKFFALVLTLAMVTAMFAVTASAEAGTIKIGMSGPLTGGAAVYGTAVARAAQIAVDEVNALGGLQFELNCQDDEHDAEKAVSAYNTLKDWGMQMLCGTVTTKPCLAVGPEANEDRIFMVTPSASAMDVAYCGDNVFQICFIDPAQGAISANVIAEKELGTKIGVIYDSSDVYSTGILESFAEEAETLGLEIVCTEAFTSDTKADLTTQVTKCKESEADLVFLPIYYTEASQILTTASKIGYAPLFFGVDGMDGILDVEGFDTSLAEGLHMLTPFAADAKDERTAAFVAAYKEAYNEVPNQFAADAYDVIWAMYQAATAAGLDGSESNEEICDAMIEQFTTMTYDGITGAGMTWDEDGFVSKAGSVVKIQDGAYVSVE